MKEWHIQPLSKTQKVRLFNKIRGDKTDKFFFLPNLDFKWRNCGHPNLLNWKGRKIGFVTSLVLMILRVNLFNYDKNQGKDISSVAAEPAPISKYWRNRLSHMYLQMDVLHSFLKDWYHCQALDEMYLWLELRCKFLRNGHKNVRKAHSRESPIEFSDLTFTALFFLAQPYFLSF